MTAVQTAGTEIVLQPYDYNERCPMAQDKSGQCRNEMLLIVIGIPKTSSVGGPLASETQHCL